ncbi:MAG: ABC transporter ATP-binding protein, partial [Chloroflexota bacterium]|nr:ABC transporter ATP-binding protein [Chloroflexota bacterium]
MTTSGESVATVEGLVHSYGDLTAVDDLSFSIAKGEVFGLLGPNGAGKSTTISILSCVLERTGGRVEVLGGDAGPNNRSIKARVGLVPQDLALYEEISGLDNLKFFGRLYGLSGSRLGTAIESALETVGLSDRASDTVSEYSGGMKRRLNLAAGRLHDPEILILDEPTVGVDPQSRNHIFDNVERLNAGGTTVIYTTHYMEEAERLCDRVAIVDHGRLVALGTPRELIDALGGGVIQIGVPEDRRAAAEADLVALDRVTSASPGPDGTLDLQT